MTVTANNGFGAQRFPASSGTTSAAQLDPGKWAIMGLLEAAINAELGDAWGNIVGQLEPTHSLARNDAKPVGVVSPVELTPQVMNQWKAAWPVLTVYREGEPEFSQFTTHYNQLTQSWSVDFVIGPLDVGKQVILGGFCVAVARVIHNTIDAGYHPAYENGARQFFGQFSTIRVKSIQGPGVAQSLGEESGSGYYGMTVTLETTERQVFDGYAATGTFETDTGYVPVDTGTATELEEIWTDVDFDNETTDAVDDDIPT